MTADYDSPWKEALDAYFEPFLALLFPLAHRQIDWSRGHEALDKEFQQVVPEAEIGRRYVDKLVKVWTAGGEECWVLIHIEVQTTSEPGFAQRMYVYNFRVYNRYNKPVASLAVLADNDPNWRPQGFRSELFGCEVAIRFPTVKLLDFVGREAVLEGSDNPFAKVVLAHLMAIRTRSNLADRHAWKLRLVRGLYEQGLGGDDVRKLLRLIAWMMELPPSLEVLFREELTRFLEERRMPYITSLERVWLQSGFRQCLEQLLQFRFGEEGLQLMSQIKEIHDEERLKAILLALATPASLEEVRRLCSPGSS